MAVMRLKSAAAILGLLLYTLSSLHEVLGQNQPTTITGNLAILVLDDFESGRAEYRYQLMQSGENRTVDLEPHTDTIAQDLKALAPNSAVEIRGSWKAGDPESSTLVVENVRLIEPRRPAPDAPPSVAVRPGESTR